MTTLRLILTSIALCGFIYTAAIHSFARIANPEQASGSLVKNPDGRIVGSRLVAQAFTSDRYFHPRPSACDYNARAAAGSNLSPHNPKLTDRAKTIISYHRASAENPIPSDLVAASGSGLDPDITEAAARYQAERVAKARGMNPTIVLKAIDETKRPLMGRFGGPPLVNVLELNLALDRISR
jgi:potassium-transporting ATPase KdpC subunit